MLKIIVLSLIVCWSSIVIWNVSKSKYYEQGVDDALDIAAQIIEEEKKISHDNGVNEAASNAAKLMQQLCDNGTPYELQPNGTKYYCISDEALKKMLEMKYNTPEKQPNFLFTSN